MVQLGFDQVVKHISILLILAQVQLRLLKVGRHGLLLQSLPCGASDMPSVGQLSELVLPTVGTKSTKTFLSFEILILDSLLLSSYLTLLRF